MYILKISTTNILSDITNCLQSQLYVVAYASLIQLVISERYFSLACFFTGSQLTCAVLCRDFRAAIQRLLWVLWSRLQITH